jgi:dienelactone hydrolase
MKRLGHLLLLSAFGALLGALVLLVLPKSTTQLWVSWPFKLNGTRRDESFVAVASPTVESAAEVADEQHLDGTDSSPAFRERQTGTQAAPEVATRTTVNEASGPSSGHVVVSITSTPRRVVPEAQGDATDRPRYWCFQTGAPEQQFVSDSDMVCNGSRSVLIGWDDDSHFQQRPGMNTLWQVVHAAAYRGTRVELSVHAKMRTPDTVMLFVDTKTTQELAQHPRGYQTRPQTIARLPVGTNWIRLSVVADVSQEAAFLYYGVSYVGGGPVWLDDVRLARAAELPTTQREYDAPTFFPFAATAALASPTNLDFELVRERRSRRTTIVGVSPRRASAHSDAARFFGNGRSRVESRRGAFVFMANTYTVVAATTLLALATQCLAQPLSVAPAPIPNIPPLESAPPAERGPYEVTIEAAFGSPGFMVLRPKGLEAFPGDDTLPVLVWGNGGCVLNSAQYVGFLSTIASHGFLVLATFSETDATPWAVTADKLRAAIDWADAENERATSPLLGKIATDQVAVMGQSCGGFLAIRLGADPRVDTIGVFNSGIQADTPPPPAPYVTAAALAKLHGPVLLVNGHKSDRMMAASKATFDAIRKVPTFYGARHNAGHVGTVFEPGGGEFANVASSWLMWWFKGDRKAGEMFAGRTCALCENPSWDVETKRWPTERRQLKTLRHSSERVE